MNIPAILKAIAAGWKISGLIAEWRIRSNEYKKIKAEQAELRDSIKRDMPDNDQLHPVGDMETWTGENRSD